MEESKRLGQTLLCSFIDFRKAFDTIPRNIVRDRMVELGIQSRWGVACMYEKVVCRLKKAKEFSHAFLSNIGEKQGGPLYPTLFGL